MRTAYVAMASVIFISRGLSEIEGSRALGLSQCTQQYK